MRTKNTVFEECQQPNRRRALLFMTPVYLLLIGYCIKFEQSNVSIILFTVSMIIFIINLFFYHMHTIVDKEGVHINISLLPFYKRTRSFFWEDISEAYIRTYNSIKEYGGWGIRTGMFNFGGTNFKIIRFSHKKRGDAYNISGATGLQLVLQNGKKVLIGTNNPGELSEILSKLGKAGKKQYG